jgi:hypothetical protein
MHIYAYIRVICMHNTYTYVLRYTCAYAREGGHMVLSSGYKDSTCVIRCGWLQVALVATFAVFSSWTECVDLL